MRASSERGRRPTSTADSSRSAQEERKKARGGEGERVRAQSLICVPAFLCVAVCVQAPWSSSSTGIHSFPIILRSLWARTQSHIPASLLLITVWLQGGDIFEKRCWTFVGMHNDAIKFMYLTHTTQMYFTSSFRSCRSTERFFVIGEYSSLNSI